MLHTRASAKERRERGEPEKNRKQRQEHTDDSTNQHDRASETATRANGNLTRWLSVTQQSADAATPMGRHANPQAAAAATLSAQQKDAATIAALQQQLSTLTAHLDAQTRTHAAQLTQARIEADEQERKHALALEKLERQHAIRAAEMTGKRGTAPTFGRTGSVPMARATSLVRANSQLLGSDSSSHAADSHAAAASSSSTSDVALLRSQLDQKDALLSALQSRFDAQSLELHKSLQSCARLQTHVDLINRQIRFGDDYKTLLKYAAVKAYVRQYKEYARARELHRALAEIMHSVAEQERARSGLGGGTATKRGSTVSSPTKSAAPATANPPSPLQRFSLTQPAGSVADSTVLPVVQTSLSAEPSLVNPSAAAAASKHASPRRSSAAATGAASSSSSFLFADLAAQDSTEQGGASGSGSSSAGLSAQNEVASWIASDRAMWTAEKTGFAKLAAMRRERGDRLAFQLQYALQPASSAYRDPAAASAASSAPASASTFTAPSSVTPSAHLSRYESQRLRESEKRRRASEESAAGGGSSSHPPRTFNAWTHWAAKHAALVAEAPALLAIALQEAYARESTARATTKLWQQRNTQLLLDCAALQKEKGVVLTGSRKESTRVQQLEAALQDALSKVCVCTKIAEGMTDGNAKGHCLCDCVEDCSCTVAARSSSQSQSQAARIKQRKNQRRIDQQQWRAETAARFDAADGGHVTEESKTASSAAAAPASPSAAALQASGSLASLTSQFGTSLGGGRNARTHDLLNEHSNFPRRNRRPSRSQHASPNRNLQHSFSATDFPSSVDPQQPLSPHAPHNPVASLSSSNSSVDVNSVPFLQRIIRTLRSRLLFSRSIILHLQADKQTAASKGKGKQEESGPQPQQEEEKADSSKRTTATINFSSGGGSSSVHQTPQKPHPPHTDRSHMSASARSVHRAHHSSRPSSASRASPRASADPLPPLHGAQPNGSPAPPPPSHAQLLSRQHASVTSLSQPLETAACPALSLSSSTRTGLTDRLSTDLEAAFKRSVSQVQATSTAATPTPRRSQYQLHPSPPPSSSAAAPFASTPSKLRHSWSSHPLAPLPLPLHAAGSPASSRASVGVTASPAHRSSAKVHLLQSMPPKPTPAAASAAGVAASASAAVVV